VNELEDAARWFWEDFLEGGCAYEEQGPGTGMTDKQAQDYTNYLPCTDSLRKSAETSQEGFTSGPAQGNVASIGENDKEEAIPVTTTVKANPSKRPAQKTGNPQTDAQLKHLKDYQPASRHERLAKHLLAIGQQPADLDDHAALVALHATVCGPQAEAKPEPQPEPVKAETTPEPAVTDPKPAKAEKQPATKRTAKQALFRLAVEALDQLVKDIQDRGANDPEHPEYATVLAGLSTEDAARAISQAIHHFPTGGEWPATILPKPERSNWK
jgi:chemotaxis protein histidine kinase CheA